MWRIIEAAHSLGLSYSPQVVVFTANRVDVWLLCTSLLKDIIVFLVQKTSTSCCKHMIHHKLVYKLITQQALFNSEHDH